MEGCASTRTTRGLYNDGIRPIPRGAPTRREPVSPSVLAGPEWIEGRTLDQIWGRIVRRGFSTMTSSQFSREVTIESSSRPSSGARARITLKRMGAEPTAARAVRLLDVSSWAGASRWARYSIK